MKPLTSALKRRGARYGVKTYELFSTFDAECTHLNDELRPIAQISVSLCA